MEKSTEKWQVSKEALRGPPPDSKCVVSAQDRVEKGVAVNHHQSGCGWFDCLRGEHPKLEKKINLKTNIALLFI